MTGFQFKWINAILKTNKLTADSANLSLATTLRAHARFLTLTHTHARLNAGKLPRVRNIRKQRKVLKTRLNKHNPLNSLF